jgi:phage terminase large subunit-like protein
MTTEVIPQETKEPEVVVDNYSVDDLLDAVDYSFKDYKPSDDAFLFMSFMRMVLGEEPENSNSLSQYFMIDVLFNHVDPRKYYGIRSDIMRPNYYAVLCHREFSKLHTSSEKIFTPNGWRTMGDLKIGDKVINRYGKETKIVRKSNPMRPQMYRMTLEDGTTQDIGEDHLHILWTKNQVPSREYPEVVLTTKEIYEHRQVNGYGIPLVSPIELSDKEYKLHPYYAGYSYAKNENTYITMDENYLFGSLVQRIDLLRGYMDILGSIHRKECILSTINYMLAMDVIKIVRTLGGISFLEETIDEDDGSVIYTVIVDMKLNPFGASPKGKIWKPSTKRSRKIINLEKIPCTEDGFCIEVESNCKSYLAGTGLTVTHNSVLIGTMYVLFIAYYGKIPNFGKVNFGGYIGNSMRKGVRQNMQTIAGVYKDSDFLQGRFETVHFTDTSVKFVRHPKKNPDGTTPLSEKKEGPRTFTLEGYGAQGGPRGSRDGLVRPQFFIVDDVIGSAVDANSDVILGNIKTLIEEDIGYALHGGNSFCIYIGTPFNLRDPLMTALVDGTWKPIVFPICEKISPTLTKEEFKGSWEDRHSYERVMTKYKTALHKGTLPAFMQEQMLRVASEDDKIVRKDMINWFNRSDVIANGGSYNWYITTDFTTTGSRSSDFSAIAVWAVNNNADLMLVDLSVKKVELTEQYSILFDMVRKYKKHTGFIEVGIETSGGQNTHIFALRELMAKNNMYFTVAIQKGKNKEGIMRTKEQGNKFQYFLPIVPWFQSGKFWFPRELENTTDMQELLAELSYVTVLGFGAVNDDALDILSQLSQLNILTPFDSPKNVKAIEYDNGGSIYDVEVIEDTERSSLVF